MNRFFRQTMALARKDLLASFREGSHLVALLLFGLLLTLLFSFALSMEPELLRRMAPGIFWLALLFSSTLAVERSFRRETEDGQWEGLLLLGTDPKALYLGKFFANLLFLILLELFLLPVMAVLYDLPLSLPLVWVLLLGSFGIASLGTFYAGVTASFREGQVLLPILLFPMLVPLLLAAVQATGLVIAHDLFGQKLIWMKLLIAFDFIFFLGSLLLADLLFEEPLGGK